MNPEQIASDGYLSSEIGRLVSISLAGYLMPLVVYIPPLPYRVHIHDSGHYVRIADSTKTVDIEDSQHYMRIENGNN